jgi:putative hemolysin
VGEIEDEHDEVDLRVREAAPGRYLVDAGISIYDLEDLVGEDVRPNEEGDYESLGGMLVEFAGRVPEAGESIHIGDWKVVVREADERHVTRVELVKEQKRDVEAAE